MPATVATNFWFGTLAAMSKGEDELRSELLAKIVAASGMAASPGKSAARKKSARAKLGVPRKALTVRLDPAPINQFKTLAQQRGKTQEAALAEALNLLFRKYGEPEIA